MSDHSTPPVRRTSPMFINGRVLVVSVDLAAVIGLEQAIILQQVHWWIEQRRNFRDGRYWVYNSYPQWHEQFPFIAVRSLKRIIPQMEADGLLLSANYNAHRSDRTKWYTVNYDHPALNPSDDSVPPWGQTGTMDDPDRIDLESAKVDRSVPNVTKEITTEETDDQFAVRNGTARGYGKAVALGIAAQHTRDGVLNRGAFLDAIPRR